MLNKVLLLLEERGVFAQMAREKAQQVACRAREGLALELDADEEAAKP